jgi:signal transduction histidine kinase
MMLKSLKHISPKTKILFVVFILILLPGVILSYLGLQSIDQNAENLRTKYVGTIDLVRDKLESEIVQLEENFRNSLIEQFPTLNKDDDLKVLLGNTELDNPVFKNLFLVNADGGLISTSVSLGWRKLRKIQTFRNPKAAANFKLAEKAEFIKKNFVEAIVLYKKALSSKTSSQERALLLSRIGRCYFKMGKIKEGINEYKKILKLGNEDITIGNVPTSIVALSQIADGYGAMNASKEQYKVMLELYQRLLDHPWDLSGEDYLYYLKSISTEIQSFDSAGSNINSIEKNNRELMNREGKLLEQIRFIKVIDKNIVHEIESNLKRGTVAELHPQHISWQKNNSIVQLGYFPLPSTVQKSQFLALGYQINNEYILLNVLPEILTGIDLGRDVFTGILDEKDSLLYPLQDRPVNNYLVAENFTQLYVSWKVALFDRDGKSIEELVGRERQLYLALFIGIIVVMLIGIVFTVRAVIHESEVSRIRSEFVSNVSHELKTPLSLIRMFGETLDTGIVTDEKKRREFYSIIRKESERLTHLINNVLDFSRVDSGTKEYNFGEADLVKVVRDSLEAYKFHIRDLGFKIESKLPAKLLMPKIDKDAISQVLLNLLSNAVKYSDNRKYIGVEVGKNSTSALISIADHGMGISKEQLKKIFDKFYRVPTPEVKETRGSGLGLTLAKHIIEAHGGMIEVESEVGKGSTFTIGIPL